MKYYVISLKRTPDRLRTFNEVNHHAGNVELFDAVDGRELNIEDLQKTGLIHPDGSTYALGSIGCALSHKTLWEKAIASDEPVTILEDDVILHPGFFKQVEKATSVEHNGHWNFLLWGWNFDSPLNFSLPGNLSPCHLYLDQDFMRHQIANFRRRQIAPSMFRLYGGFGLCAYTVTPQAARELIAHCFPLSRKQVFCSGVQRLIDNHDIDIAMQEYYQKPGSLAYACFPPTAITPNDHNVSTIRGAEDVVHENSLALT